MKGRNFINGNDFDWHEDQNMAVCKLDDHVLFTIFNDTRKSELVNAYNAGLQEGMRRGRLQKIKEAFIAIFGDR